MERDLRHRRPEQGRRRQPLGAPGNCDPVKVEMIGLSDLDEFSEKLQTAFDPPSPRFGKLCCTFFLEVRKSATKFFVFRLGQPLGN